MSTKQDRRSFLKLGATVGTGLALGGTSLAGDEQAQKEDLTIFDVIKKRRSVRKFKSTPVPKEHIMKILDAANFAPTPRNRQAWRYLVIQDRAKLDQLKGECIKEAGEQRRQYYTDYLSAPVYIVILADSNTRNPENDLIAASVSVGYLMLAARALGYGTVFCRNSISKEIVRKLFNIPDRFKWVCITPVGVPETWPESPPKKNLDELVAYDTF